MSTQRSKQDKAAAGAAAKGALSWRQRQAAKRIRRRGNVSALAVQPVAAERRAKDPINHRRVGAGLYIGLAALLVVGAVGVHAMILFAFFGLSSALGSGQHTSEKVEKVEVAVNITEPEPPEPEPEPPKPPEPEPEPPEPEEEIIQEPEPEPEPEKPKPKPKPRPKKPAPPPDPIDKPKDPPPEPPKKKARRVVGLNMESTTNGGDGPAFASGNTRMGETDTKAENPNKVEKIAPGDTQGTPGAKSGEASPNKVSRRIPGSGSGGAFKGARYKGGKRRPAYPEALRRRQIEGNVTVTVNIGVDGRVVSAKVIKSSGQPALDQAALATARAQLWTPAQKDGKPVPDTKSYTYRFRLTDF